MRLSLYVRSLGEIAASHLHQRRLEAEEKQEKGGGGKSTVCVLSFFLQRLSLCVRKVPRGGISAAVPPLSVAAVPRVALMGEVGENIWRVIALNVRILSPR